jgi:hypothetical protein
LVGLLSGLQPAQPIFAWGKNYFRIPITAGELEAAEFVRRQARPGDVAAVAPVDPTASLQDRAIEFVGLTDMPSYLARPAIQTLLGGRHRRAALDRLAIMGKLAAETDATTAFALMRQSGITWYVQIGGEGPRFDPNRSLAAYAISNATVYRVEPGKPAG